MNLSGFNQFFCVLLQLVWSHANIFWQNIVPDIFKAYSVWRTLSEGVCMFHNKHIAGVEIFINIKFKKKIKVQKYTGI